MKTNSSPLRARSSPHRGLPDSDQAGRRLRDLRESMGLTLHDVASLSRNFAQTEQNPAYAISTARLSQLEIGKSTPGLYKVVTLSRAYNIPIPQILRWYGIDLGESDAR